MANVDTKIDAIITEVNKLETGTTGQFLRKQSGTGFDIGFANLPETQKVSSNDTTPGYLNGKLVAGSGIALTENNDGSNETLSVSVSNFAKSTPTPLNNWLFQGSASYAKDADNVVRVAAFAARSGDEGSGIVFNLPVGFRPTENKSFLSSTELAVVLRVTVETNGNVTVVNFGSVGSYVISLDMIQFRTDM